MARPGVGVPYEKRSSLIDAMMRPRGYPRGRRGGATGGLSCVGAVVLAVGRCGRAARGRGVVHAQPVAIAQEATPAGVEIGGVTFEPVAFATGIDLPSPGDLLVARAALDPGGVVPIAAR